MTSTPISAGCKGWPALIPVVAFLAIYLVASLLTGSFYSMPVAVALAAASALSIAMYKGHSLTARVALFSKSAAHPDIIYMIWIFILAGAFAAAAKGIGAIDATVAMALRFFPGEWVMPGLFLSACLISLSIGTSVGTVVAITPLAVEMAHTSVDPSGATAMYVAAVVGGAFFGDNLSFISDTTIAATRSQGCSMADKFQANVWIVVPAAVVTLLVYIFVGYTASVMAPQTEVNPWLTVPYLLVLATAIAGLNVVAVLALGIASAIITGLCASTVTLPQLCAAMGEGIDSMGNLIVVTLLAAGMVGMVKEMGGIEWLIDALSRRVTGRRGAQASIALLAASVDVCTANNTVAIITVGSISASIARRFGVDPRKSASLLDTASCIAQCLIPYGAQMLMASSLANISPAAPWPYLYYPWALTLFTILSIIFLFPRRLKGSHPSAA
ncbi:MAG: Na+/H+ antiporter NhaC family protein [Pseudoflavonifractor sp.]|nr:Na+/H+ antiporter NhaC family protein [Alloprevotella sp.]MCM1116392.1 Na+/H+ antiporter NhaC family protein [Pseudoflavonifractor sp.]